ncbi:MAG: Dabb family protein [Glaciihabitans sp.]|nr:Dabb family protein [Glaciihabitans sp.]MDQ1571275.1 hypothetical protein [Actinomycetota bacterium]
MSLDLLQQELESVGVERFTSRDYGVGPVTHIVLFRYAPATSVEQRADVARRFHALAATQRSGEPYILSIESGAQLSGEVAPGGFEQAFIVKFSSLGDRNFYVGEPVFADSRYYDTAHASFKEFVGPLLATAPAGALVFDFQ